MIKLFTEENKLNDLLNKVESYRISYINKQLIINDFRNKRLYVFEENDEIKAICSIEYSEEYDTNYIKRLLVFEAGKGYSKKMLKYMTENVEKPLAITPFEDNKSVISTITKLGFKYKYTFLEDYMYFELN